MRHGQRARTEWSLSNCRRQARQSLQPRRSRLVIFPATIAHLFLVSQILLLPSLLQIAPSCLIPLPKPGWPTRLIPTTRIPRLRRRSRAEDRQVRLPIFAMILINGKMMKMTLTASLLVYALKRHCFSPTKTESMAVRSSNSSIPAHPSTQFRYSTL